MAQVNTQQTETHIFLISPHNIYIYIYIYIYIIYIIFIYIYLYIYLYIYIHVCVCKYMHLLLQMLCADLSHMTLLQGLLLFDPFARIILLQGLGETLSLFQGVSFCKGCGGASLFQGVSFCKDWGQSPTLFQGLSLGVGTLTLFQGLSFAMIGARHLPFFKGCHVRAIPFFKGFAEHPFARAGSSLKDCNL